ncbi:hypothetical protein [Actinoallomurus iriomotensis]|nr:hypothetical protein [Actinoallomurus iriomotensis]
MRAVALMLAGSIVTGTPAPGHRVMLGAVGQTRQEVQQRESETGHRLEGVRVFRRWDEPLFDAHQEWARRTGHTVFVSIKARRKNGAKLSWRDIAAARPGSPLWADMQRQAKEIKRFRALVYVVFNHEPDARTSAPMGGPADFVAAWRNLVTTYRAAGVRNARYVWTMTGWAFSHNAGHGLTDADLYYPGDAYVDDIAGDSYNWNTCHSGSGRWESPAELVDPERRFGLRHPAKGLMLLEFGSVEDPARPGRKAQWLRDMGQLLTSPAYRQFRAALYWDDQHTGQRVNAACDFDYRTSPDSLNAWRALAAVPALAARSSCELGDCAAAKKKRRHPSRPLIIAGGAPVALIVAGLVALGIHRRRRAVARRPTGV